MSNPHLCVCGHDGEPTASGRCKRCGQVEWLGDPGAGGVKIGRLFTAPSTVTLHYPDGRTREVDAMDEPRRYNANPSAAPDFGGQPFPFMPAYVLDAKGANVGPVIACDLDTGEAIAYALGKDGEIRIYNDLPLTCRFQFLPPLTVVPREWQWEQPFAPPPPPVVPLSH